MLAHVSGGAIEEFYQTLSHQVAEFGANLVVPVGDGDLIGAAESGEESIATAYRCPE